MYKTDVPKFFSDPQEPPKKEKVELKARTLTERQAARLEMMNLNARILEGFKNRAKHVHPRSIL